MRCWVPVALTSSLLACGVVAPADTPPPTGSTPEDSGAPAPTHSDGDCLADDVEATLGTDPLDADTDDDGLDDCAEAQLHGTDPLAADSDRDGLSDGAEVACVSDPSDADERCYACGWPHGDPGTLLSTGDEVGDVVDDMTLWDQCEEPLSLYDLHGSYVVVFTTTMWCGTCLDEARALGAEVAALAVEVGAPVVPLVTLFQDLQGNPPLTDQAAHYAQELGLSGFPVTVDQVQATTSDLPYEPDLLPGKCVLSPELVILGCHAGPGGQDTLRDWIAADAAR
jgi:hypothetical protein